MKKIFVFIVTAVILLTACNRPDSANTSQVKEEYDVAGDTSFKSDDDYSAIADENSKQEEEDMQMLLTMGDTTLTVNLENCETTNDFISMLPMTVNMHDYFNRIKYSYFSEPISENGPKQTEYEVGDIAYWP